LRQHNFEYLMQENHFDALGMNIDKRQGVLTYGDLQYQGH
jgi:hypothetical protein